MKAIDIIKALLTNCYNMEQMGLYTHESIKDAKDFFGDGYFCNMKQNGAVQPGMTFLYIYKTDDCDDAFLDSRIPDAWFYTEDGSEIALLQIHDA